MPIITIQLTGSTVTQDQKDALVAKSTMMVSEVLSMDPGATGVVIEETGAVAWGMRTGRVTHRFRSPGEHEHCLITRWNEQHSSRLTTK